MNKELFTQILIDPDQLQQVSYQELKKAVLEFPYCQNLRLLLMQKSQLEQNEELPQNIQSVAAYSNNRSHFYRAFKAKGGMQEKLNAVQLAEDFLEDSKNKISVPPLESPKDIPTATAPTNESSTSANIDAPSDRMENISHEKNSSNYQRMEDDDAMEFDLNEHLKKFREEKIEPETTREESPLKKINNKALFLEDLINKNEEVDQNTSPPSKEEIGDNSTTKESPADLPTEDQLPPIAEEENNIAEEEIETVTAEEIEAMPPQSISIPIDNPIDKWSSEVEEQAVESNHNNDDEAEVLATNEEEEEEIEEIPVPELILPPAESLELPPSESYTEKKEGADITDLEQVTVNPKQDSEKMTDPTNIPLEITNLDQEKSAGQPGSPPAPKPTPTPTPKTSFSSWLKQFEAPEIQINEESSTLKSESADSSLPDESPEQHLTAKTRKTTRTNADQKIRLEDLIEAKKKKSRKKKKKDKGTSKLNKSKKSKKKEKKSKKQEKIIDFAAQSLNENEEIASETLAQILGRQGSYDKAIRIYERLKLIYPEKSVFFASEIEKLNKLK